MREFAEGFYKTQAWKDCRKAYAKSQGYLCEKCREKGIIRKGEIVHHKVHLSPENIKDPTVTLNWNNLELLCRDHHALAHKPDKRFKVDDLGRVTAL